MTATPRLRARNRSKSLERATAKRLRGHRNGATGLATADVEAGPFAIECKSRKELPGWLLDAMAQAVRNAPEGKMAIVILHQLNQRHDADIVCMRMRDWVEWHREIQTTEEE